MPSSSMLKLQSTTGAFPYLVVDDAGGLRPATVAVLGGIIQWTSTDGATGGLFPGQSKVFSKNAFLWSTDALALVTQ